MKSLLVIIMATMNYPLIDFQLFRERHPWTSSWTSSQQWSFTIFSTVIPPCLLMAACWKGSNDSVEVISTIVILFVNIVFKKHTLQSVPRRTNKQVLNSIMPSSTSAFFNVSNSIIPSCAVHIMYNKSRLFICTSKLFQL